MPLQMAREHEDLYLIILTYYRGAALANQKGNPDYHTGYTYIKLEFATALNVRTQDYITKRGLFKCPLFVTILDYCIKLVIFCDL